MDRDEVRREITEKLASERLSRGGIAAFLAELYPESDAMAMAYAASSNLPMVQVPTGRGWGYSNRPLYALARDWLGRDIAPESELHGMIKRYLAAFGPASVMDFQAWAGITKTRPFFEEMRPELRTFRDGNGKELFDLPDAPRPGPDTPSPPRFVPDYDNLVLSHADRTRIIADEHRKSVFLPAARVRATILVDGFVAGTWKVEEKRREAVLTVEPFGKPRKDAVDALLEEGERLIRFVKPEAVSHHVRFDRR